MNKFCVARRAAFHAALVAALVSGGCGGAFSGDDDAQSSDTSQQTGSNAGGGTSTSVSSAELITNPRFETTQGWTLRDSSVVTTSQWADGKAMKVTSSIAQTLSADRLKPGKAYTLRVKARNEKGAGTAAVVVNFRNASGATYRNYRKTFQANGTGAQEYTLDFVAPSYVTGARVEVGANDTSLSIDSVSLKQRSTINQTEPVASNANSHVPSGYKLVFNDEFNGNTLNREKWFTRYIYSSGTLDRLNDEQQRYRDNDNHRVSNGVLSLIARKVSNNDPSGIDWESGMIRSDFTIRYGYFEARVKVPGGLGVWPAFWLNSDVSSAGRLGWPPEIDIFEFVNNGGADKANMIHSGVVTRGTMPASQLLYADAGFNKQWTYWTAPYNFDDAWHTIGGEWTENQFTMYVDGKKIYTRTYKWTLENGNEAGPAHILLNLAMGGHWAGRHGVDASQQEFKIDWVRAYKKN